MPDALPDSPPEPACKKVLALLTPEPVWEAALCGDLEKILGPIDYRGPFFPFEGGNYYASEMGGPLYRGWLSFRGLASPGDLAGWKIRARALEREWSRAGRRTRNLDVGYLDPDKLVLASFKQGPFKLYLEQGVWADMILGYSRGTFTPAARAFADFRSGRYDASLKIIREKLKAEMRR